MRYFDLWSIRISGKPNCISLNYCERKYDYVMTIENIFLTLSGNSYEVQLLNRKPAEDARACGRFGQACTWLDRTLLAISKV
jgi:hypothetical protein